MANGSRSPDTALRQRNRNHHSNALRAETGSSQTPWQQWPTSFAASALSYSGRIQADARLRGRHPWRHCGHAPELRSRPRLERVGRRGLRNGTLRPSRARGLEHVKTSIHRTQMSRPSRVCPNSRVEWLLAIDFEMPVLQPSHDDPRQTRRPAVGIAVAPMHLAPARQVGRLRTGQQFRECVHTARIESLEHPAHDCMAVALDCRVPNGTGRASPMSGQRAARSIAVLKETGTRRRLPHAQ
jgi:hypothetical protein